jgi:3-deoxy-manno-octulosonate cytidylyltransferase (CMP-KDO synthetase)
MSFKVVIPARLDSSRLSRKALREVAGKPLVQWTYQQAIKVSATEVIIATDSEEIAKVARGFGATVCMTSSDHLSGTSRLAEVAKIHGWDDTDIVVNVQGDEPLIPVAYIHEAAQALHQAESCDMATLCCPITAKQDILSPHVVKVVFNQAGHALYFSRSPIPHQAEIFPGHYFKHIGIYAYRVGFLQQYSQWAPCKIEKSESLEQLRALWYGAKIKVSEVEGVPHTDVNTAEDLELVRESLSCSRD